MTSAGGETLHPSLAEAVDECETLTRAAELVGAVSPEKSISEIDFDPDTVQDFVDDLKPSLVELDEAIGDATTVEDGVRQACEEVAGICSDAQDELDDLAETFRSLSGEEDDRGAGGGVGRGDDDSDD